MAECSMFVFQIANYRELVDCDLQWIFKSSSERIPRIEFILYGPSILCASANLNNISNLNDYDRPVLANILIRRRRA